MRSAGQLQNWQLTPPRGALDPDAVTEDVFASYLDTAGIPDPDLLTDTSGERACLITFYGSWLIQSFM